MRKMLLCLLSSLLFVSCASGPYKHVKGPTDLSSMEEVMDSVPAQELVIGKQENYTFVSTTAPHVFFADRKYRTTAKPYKFTIAEPGTYQIKVQTMLPTFGQTINIPAIEIYNLDKKPCEIKKISQRLRGPGIVDNASLVTFYEANLTEVGPYFLIASSDLTKKEGIPVDIVNEYGVKTGQITYQASPYSGYRTKITKKDASNVDDN